jgi:hypothetical protein
MAKVFFSYSHDDEAYRDQLEKHLALLRHEGLIESWHDRRILAGADLNQVIDDQLNQADVILLLVSASFLSSRYCYSVEMARALERQSRGEAQVVPVIVRPCDWQQPPLNGLMAVPRDGKAITTWANHDEAYTDVARSIRSLVTQLGGRTHVAGAPSRAQPLAAASALPSEQVSLPRSSNLRLRKEFTERDQDAFQHAAFDYLARFFEGSLAELQARTPGVEGVFRRIDGNAFSGVVYKDGKKLSQCGIRLGGGGFRQGGITYSSDPSAPSGSYNEMVMVEKDDQAMYFKPLGMAMHRGRSDKLTQEGLAEFFWELLIKQLQ